MELWGFGTLRSQYLALLSNIIKFVFSHNSRYLGSIIFLFIELGLLAAWMILKALLHPVPRHSYLLILNCRLLYLVCYWFPWSPSRSNQYWLLRVFYVLLIQCKDCTRSVLFNFFVDCFLYKLPELFDSIKLMAKTPSAMPSLPTAGQCI